MWGSCGTWDKQVFLMTTALLWQKSLFWDRVPQVSWGNILDSSQIREKLSLSAVVTASSMSTKPNPAFRIHHLLVIRKHQQLCIQLSSLADTALIKTNHLKGNILQAKSWTNTWADNSSPKFKHPAYVPNPATRPELSRKPLDRQCIQSQSQ